MKPRKTDLVFIVFEMLQPYGSEVVNLLALPSGLYARFRYRLRWFATDEPTGTAPADCLICIRATRAGTVMPLRYGRLMRVHSFGNTYLMEVRLGSLVALSPNPGTRNEQLAHFHSEFVQHVLASWANVPGHGMERLVFPTSKREWVVAAAPVSLPDPSRTVGAWDLLVSTLVEFAEYSATDFLFVEALESNRHQRAKVTVRGWLELQGGRDYKMTVHQQRATVKPVSSIELRCDGRTVVPILTARSALGKYDVLEFYFATDVAQSAPKFATLAITRSAPGDVSMGNPIVLPLVVQRRSLLIEGAISCLFWVSALALLVPQQKFVQFLGWQPTTFDAVRNIAIVAAILSAQAAGRFGPSLVNKLFRV